MKPTHYLGCLLCATAALLPAAAVWAAPNLLAFPARGTVDLDEGTVECWICFEHDPLAVELDPKGRSYHGWGELLGIGTGDPVRPGFLRISFFSKVDRYEKKSFSARTAVLRMPKPGHSYIPMPRKTLAGAWYHIAFTWSRSSYNSYVNGDQARVYSGRRLMDFDARFHDTARIILGAGVGGRGRRSARFAIDEFRVSSVARRPEDLGAHGPLKPDLFTTLLLTFDDPAELPDGLPAYMEYVEGKYGRGLDLAR